MLCVSMEKSGSKTGSFFSKSGEIIKAHRGKLTSRFLAKLAKSLEVWFWTSEGLCLTNFNRVKLNESSLAGNLPESVSEDASISFMLVCRLPES